MKTTKRQFKSVSGICENGYVVATITQFENPSWVTITGSVGNEPFVFGAGVQYSAVHKTLDALYERHPLSRNDIDEAISDALAQMAAQS